MVSKTVILLFAVLAAVSSAEDSPKDKRGVVVGAYPFATTYAAGAYGYVAPAVAPVAAPAMTYAAPHIAYAAPAYDDGKYYEGKYERPTFYSGLRHMVRYY